MKQLFWALALLAVGCQRMDGPETPLVAGVELTTSEVAYEPWFSTEGGLIPEPISKVTETHFQALDTIGVFIFTGTVGAGPYHSTNMIYYTKDGSPDGSTAPKWTAATAMGGPLNAGTTYLSTAYHPYQKTATNASAVVHQVATDQSAAAETGKAKALERSDFMWSPPVEITNPTTAPAATMTFQHLLTKLAVSVQIPTTIDGVAVTGLNGVAIKNLNTQAAIHLETGVLNNLSKVASIKPRLVSGNGTPGTVSLYEAIVVPQTVASGVVLVEVKCQTASGEKTANYFPPATGLVLGGGKKITMVLTSSADIAFTSELDLVTGQPYTDLPLKIKVANQATWSLTAPAGSWIKVSKTQGSYTTSITGTGTGTEQTVYVEVATNSTTAPREAVLNLSAKISGQDRAVTYTAVQNYSKPVSGFPTDKIVMDALTFGLPAVVGNSNWYIKATSLPQGVRLSRRNTNFNDLAAADTIALFSLSNTGPKSGYMVSGNYYNSGGSLYLVVDPKTTLYFTMVCNGRTVTVDARSILVTSLSGSKLRWARGNLVATNATPQGVGAGTNGAKVNIGDPFDGGMYFQFGSLVGYKGGAKENGGSGVGAMNMQAYMVDAQTAWTTNGTFTTFSWANDAMVWPSVFNGATNIAAKWPSGLSTNTFYFGLNTAGTWNLMGKKASDLAGFTAGTLAAAGVAVGDPCRYYLGETWRLPTAEEYGDLYRNHYANGNVGGTWDGAGITWGSPATWNRDIWSIASGNYTNNANSTVPGRGIYANTQRQSSAEAAEDPTALFFPASGCRSSSTGLFYTVGRSGYGWSGSVSTASYGFYLTFNTGNVNPQTNYNRSIGFPVRCVSE